MSGLTKEQQGELRTQFGDRVSFDPMERKIYSHDVGEIPKLIKPLLGKALADAVVQPRNEEEVIALVQWAAREGIPLVPRGKATSGYGGVMPVKGGLTVDMHRLRKTLDIDTEAMTATVRPSVIWSDLEKELTKQGLALRLYPSSAPSSTVGGWLAQGGVGYGGFEYGNFRENVVSARVVLPTGEVRDFAGADLDLISDAEGTTGIITEVTLRVRKLDPDVAWAVLFQNAESLVSALKAVDQAGLPLWSVSFQNPRLAELKNQLPPKLVHGHPVEEHRPKLPAGYIVTFVAPASQRDQVKGPLLELVKEAGGEVLDDEIAQDEWEERFNLMHVKRLGPSLVPAEVMVPLDGLAAALNEIDQAVQLPFVMEGMVSRSSNGREVTLLGFIPHDARTFGYNLAFGLALSVIKIAKAHGGRAYSTGIYFSQEAEDVLGSERLEKLRAFKREQDPKDIMNPGKVVEGHGVLPAFMGLAQTFEPVVRVMGNMAKSPVGERMEGQGRRGVPDDVAWYAYACAQCGYCVDECDQYYGRGWESESPRAKWFFLREYLEGRADFDQTWVDKFLACTTCELCNVKCPLELPNEPSWLAMRGELIHNQGKMTFPPFEIMRASLLKENNIWAAYRDQRADWVPEDKKDMISERAEIGYFPGCTASYVEHDIAQATACLMHKAGVDFTILGEDEACCAIPMLVAGLWDTFNEVMDHNIAAMKARGVKTVVTSCPACWLAWAHYYPMWYEKRGLGEYPFEAKHYSEILVEAIAEGQLVPEIEIPMRLTWHDSCHMGRAGGIFEPPRELIKAVPGVEFVEMEHNRENGHCCGSVLSLVADPPAAARIGDFRLQEAEAVGADAIVSCCPCCQVQLRVTANKTGCDIPIIDLGHLICDSMGIEHANPTEYALEMWATFEAMITLMKPEPMAGLMRDLFPQMFAAMPGPMVGMMKMAKRVPGMLSLMKPMMPAMLPILMPMLMPKVMPDMLAEVEKRVPMPDEMKEQMPDLMPAAMDRLLPKMLPDMTPYVVPMMMDYIREEL